MHTHTHTHTHTHNTHTSIHAHTHMQTCTHTQKTCDLLKKKEKRKKHLAKSGHGMAVRCGTDAQLQKTL